MPTLNEIWLLGPYFQAAYGYSLSSIVGKRSPEAVGTSDPAADELMEIALGAWGAAPSSSRLTELGSFLGGLGGFDALMIPPRWCGRLPLRSDYAKKLEATVGPGIATSSVDSAAEHALIALSAFVWQGCGNVDDPEIAAAHSNLMAQMDAMSSGDVPSATLDARCGALAALGAVNHPGFAVASERTVGIVLDRQTEDGSVPDANLLPSGGVESDREETGPHTTILCMWLLAEYATPTAPSWMKLPGTLQEFANFGG